jgi:hypothetical protein
MAQRVIEESPKLKALTEILEELSPEEYHKDRNIDILIVSNDDRTSCQIKDVYFLINFRSYNSIKII